jgi:hypothetical protein
MKTGITIFLLVLLVSIQTPVGQLFKFPALIEHFIKHQEKASVSLIDFLQDHYASDHNDADLPDDERLPFKDMTFYTIGYAIVPGVVIKTHVSIPLPADKKVIFPEAYTAYQHFGSIFHPPRA